jgi:hypothetical protein
MLSVLEDIGRGVLDLPFLVINLLIESVNGWLGILNLGMLAALAVLPGFPEVPELPSEPLGMVSFYLPIPAMLAILTAFVTAFVTWLGVSAALRWARAL